MIAEPATVTITAEDYMRLEKRVTTLEKASVNNTETLKWMAGTLGTMKATQDDHTGRLGGLDERFDGLSAEVRGVKADLASLRRDLPSIVAEAMREVLKERK
jgi:hypothetical protein